MQQFLAELKQKLLTHVANRSFRKDKSWLDRQCEKLLGPPLDHDPELDHPEG